MSEDKAVYDLDEQPERRWYPPKPAGEQPDNKKTYAIMVPDVDSEAQHKIAAGVQELGRVMLQQSAKHGDTLHADGYLSGIAPGERLLVHMDEKLEQFRRSRDKAQLSYLALKLSADFLNYAIAVGE